MSQLGGEQQRWQDQAMSLSDALSTLPLKMLLAAGFATYLVRLVEGRGGGVVWVYYAKDNDMDTNSHFISVIYKDSLSFRSPQQQ